MIVGDVIVENVASPIESVPPDTAHHATALQLGLQVCLFISQLRKAARTRPKQC